jgi:shikimate dehydrogenase
VGRDIQKLEYFMASWSDNEIKKAIKINLWSEIPNLIKNTHLLVNTTPIGMSPHTAQSPLEEKIMDLLPGQAIAYDLVYNPSPSKFLHQAQERGIKTIDGLEMLARQGAIALEIWLQQSVPGEVMLNSLRAYFSVH